MLNFWKKSDAAFSAFCEKPFRAMMTYLIAMTVIWTLQCSLLQNVLGLDVLETVTWGAQWALGHAKHPPLSGWVGYGFSALCGHADWSLYLLAQLLMCFGVFCIYQTARLFWEERTSAAAALLVYFTHYYTPSEMKFCTYPLEMALKPLMAWLFFLALQRKQLRYWLLFGIASALGILNKYSVGMLLLAMFVLFFYEKEYRKEFRSWGPYAAALVFFLILMPHLQWLSEHHFCCLRHVSSRMGEKHCWYDPLEVFFVALYPFATAAGVLILSHFPWKNLQRKSVEHPVLRRALILTLIPSAILLGLSLCGQSVIMMWFCTMSSWTGIAVIAACPWAVTKRSFKRIYFLLWGFTMIVYIATTADLLLNPRPRIHTDPRIITEAAQNFWREHGSGEIPVVCGERWFIGVVENYSAGRPPACEVNDPVFLERYHALIASRGALLIGDMEDIGDFEKEIGRKAAVIKRYPYQYKALCGKSRSHSFHLGYLPPEKNGGKR